MKIHEVINYTMGISEENSSSPASLHHIFFDTEEEARKYITEHPHHETLYLHREWGLPALMKLWVDDRRSTVCRTPECNNDPNNGEGYNGYCGSCADHQDNQTTEE